MKLWLLRPRDIDTPGNPWDPWYDKRFGFVMRAETEQDARDMAEIASGDESRKSAVWLDAELTKCEELTADGPAELIIYDEHRA